TDSSATLVNLAVALPDTRAPDGRAHQRPAQRRDDRGRVTAGAAARPRRAGAAAGAAHSRVLERRTLGGCPPFQPCAVGCATSAQPALAPLHDDFRGAPRS